MSFSDKSTFYVLKRKSQCKIWRLEKEKLLSEYSQQTNTGDGGKVGIWSGISGFGTTTANVYTENMNGQLYCDVLETELRRSMTKLSKKTKMVYQQDVSHHGIRRTQSKIKLLN